MNQNITKDYTCCFTGHRPDKTVFTEEEIKPLLKKAIDDAVENGFMIFITGMACGVDIWAAEIVLELKKQNENLMLVCALPHPGFEKRRSIYEKNKFENIIACADMVKEINEFYFSGCYQVRNEWMVDRSARVIAVYNGQPGGTRNTVNYAKKCNIPVVNVLKL